MTVELNDVNYGNSSSMERVLILSRSPISSDPRVLNQISWLQSDDFEVDVIGLGTRPKILKGEYQTLGQPNLAIRIFCYLFFWGKIRFDVVVGRYLKSALNELRANEFNYRHVLLNDLDFVPSVPGFFSKNSDPNTETTFHIDLHELFPGIVGDLRYRILFGRHTRWLLKELKKREFYSYSSVSNEIVELYRQVLEIDLALIVENVPRKHEIEIGSLNESIEIIYHGNCDRSRGVYVAVDAIGIVTNEYRLNLMLTGDYKEIKKLKKYVSTKDFSNKVRFIDPVPVTEIVVKIAQFDLGLALFDNNRNKSLELALPNKYFEYIQARLGVITGSSESMVRICKDYGLGVEVKSFTANSLAKVLSRIDRAEVERLKLGAIAAADVYNAENVEVKFLSRFHQTGE